MRCSRVATIALCATALLHLVGCADTPPPSTPEVISEMFVAREAKLHPVFTKVADFDGNGTIDGVDALVELHDQFGDTTKGAGTFTFELYAYKMGQPDPRGERLSNPWQVDVTTPEQQRERWSRASRCYTFRLAAPMVNRATSYVFTVTYAPVGGGPRSFDRIVLAGVPGAAGNSANPTVDTSGGATAPGPQGNINSLPGH